eukprot:Tamp_17718.p1 GENE.Tamp_17718~~Tamp_17718.p1  ORF type:complete len:337 (+),score=27.13 Tamp_17718:281-1291(+)
MQRTPGKAEEWAREHVPGGSCRGYSTLRDLLADPRVDAIYVATPPGAHVDVALQVAAAGKAAYIEKPVGRCYMETLKIAQAFAERHVPLFTAYTSRAFDRTAAVRKLLADGAVGDRVTQIRYTCAGSGLVRGLEGAGGGGGDLPWRLKADMSGGGLVMDVGCHLMDRIDYLCGPLIEVRGSACNQASPCQQVEDYVEIHARVGASSWAAIASEGASVECSWDFSGTSSKDELIITGPGGSLRMAGMSPSLPICVLGPKGDVVRELKFEQPQHVAQPLIQTVVDELCGVPGAHSPSRSDNALRTSAVLDAALTSFYGGRDDEFWARPDSWPGLQKRV